MKNNQARRLRKGLLCAVAAAAVAAIGLAGCAQTQEDEGTLLDQYQPKVVVRDDGVTIQRTPTENLSASPEASDAYHHPKKNVPTNLYYLDADNRGCNACHEDLVTTIESPEYTHPSFQHDMGTEWTVSQCIECHEDAFGATVPGQFGALMHSIHEDVEDASCWSCHYSSEANGEMELWDDVKHDVLHGITDVSNVEGDFDYTQDAVMSQDQLVNAGWLMFEDDYSRNDRQVAGEPLREHMIDEWMISFSGKIDNPQTFSLKELMQREDLQETMVMAYPCVEYMLGSNLLGQAEVTGISLNKLLDELGVQEGAGSIIAASEGGYTEGFNINRLKDKEALLVYEINGEPLQWEHGYPVQLWIQGAGLPFFVKNLVSIEVGSDDDPSLVFDTPYIIPCIGFTNLDEGTVVKTGEPLKLEGYAFGFDVPVDRVEFSYDRGQTWTTGAVQNGDPTRLVNWSFTWTPPEDGAYVVRARTVLADGTTSEALTRLFNAKSE